MNNQTIPDTTRALLAALQKEGEVRRVVIAKEQIMFFPGRTRSTSRFIEEAGIADLIQRFVTHSTSKSVADHFRLGSYELTNVGFVAR